MVSSYQTLARYHDCRSRDRMPTIRQQMRDDIDTSRFMIKLQHRLRLRGIPEDEPDDNESSCQDYGYDEVDGFHLDDDTHAFDLSDEQCYWSNGMTSSSSAYDAPSPCLSHDSDYSSTSYSGWGVPSTRNTPEVKPRSRPRLSRSRKDILQHRKRVQKDTYDPENVERLYFNLKANIINRLDDTFSVSQIICASWNVIRDAMEHDKEIVVRDSLDFLTQLIHRRILPITDLLFMLQQGLILPVKSMLSRVGSQQSDVVALLTCVVMVQPRATPYLIELMQDTGIISELENLITIGSDAEISLVVIFYQHLTRTLTNLLVSNKQGPVVPDTLSSTTSCEKLAMIYSPLVSLRYLITPALMDQVISRFFAHIGCASGESTGLAMMLCAECLTFIYQSFSAIDQQWARAIYQPYLDWNLVQLIKKQLDSESPRVAKGQMKDFSIFYENMCKALMRLMNRPII